MSPTESPPVAGDPPAETSLLRLAAAIVRRAPTIVVVALLAGIAAAVWSLVVTPQYRATAKFALEERTISPSAGGLAALAGQFGAGGLGGMRSLSFYADLVTGRSMLEAVALDSFPDPENPAVLRPFPDLVGIPRDPPERRLSDAIDYLTEHVNTTTNDRTGTITIDVLLPDPDLAAQVATRLYAALEEFNINTRRTTASERRRFAEREIVRARRDLSNAEAELRQFLESNRAGRDAPRLEVRRGQLERRIEILQDTYGRLAAELEEAKIDEVRDLPVLTLLQEPKPPVDRDFPRRARITITGAVLGAFLAVVWIALGASGLTARRLDPAGWNEFRSAFRRRRSA